MGLGAAHYGGMQHLGEFYIVNKRGPAREKAAVLSPRDWCTDIRLDHSCLPYWPAGFAPSPLAV